MASSTDAAWFHGSTSLSRPLGLDYDFVEIYGGAGDTSRLLSDRGFKVGPAVDLSTSRVFDMRDCRVLEWLVFMISERRLRGASCLVPCTSFSIAAHPAVRSHKCCLGFNRHEPKTLLGLQGFRPPDSLLDFGGSLSA